MEGYRSAVAAQNARAAEWALGYATEEAAYFDRHDGIERRLTFREWLVGHRRPDRHVSS